MAAREVLARLHEEAQLLAELSDQAAAVTWLKDGHALSPGPKYEVQASAGQRALLVRDVKREDAGLYECVSHGDRITYQLLVQGDTSVCVFMSSLGRRCGQGHAFCPPALDRLWGTWVAGAAVLCPRGDGGGSGALPTP